MLNPDMIFDDFKSHVGDLVEININLENQNEILNFVAKVIGACRDTNEISNNYVVIKLGDGCAFVPFNSITSYQFV